MPAQLSRSSAARTWRVRKGWIADLCWFVWQRKSCTDSGLSPAHAQDRRGSTRKPPFPHTRSAIDPVSSMLHPSARCRIALC
jgi:hypothetical protein